MHKEFCRLPEMLFSDYGRCYSIPLPFLKLDCSKVKTVFGWSPRWHVEEAIEKTVEWSKVYFAKGDIPKCMDEQINEFFGGK